MVFTFLALSGEFLQKEDLFTWLGGVFKGEAGGRGGVGRRAPHFLGTEQEERSGGAEGVGAGRGICLELGEKSVQQRPPGDEWGSLWGDRERGLEFQRPSAE